MMQYKVFHRRQVWWMSDFHSRKRFLSGFCLFFKN